MSQAYYMVTCSHIWVYYVIRMLPMHYICYAPLKTQLTTKKREKSTVQYYTTYFSPYQQFRMFFTCYTLWALQLFSSLLRCKSEYPFCLCIPFFFFLWLLLLYDVCIFQLPSFCVSSPFQFLIWFASSRKSQKLLSICHTAHYFHSIYSHEHTKYKLFHLFLRFNFVRPYTSIAKSFARVHAFFVCLFSYYIQCLKC